LSIILEKIKAMTLDEMLLAIDRLTRFKFPEEKYNRVFREIISKYVIVPKIGFKDYEKLGERDICEIVEQVFSYSISFFSSTQSNCELYKQVISFDKLLFKVQEQTLKLMNAKIPYEDILNIAVSENKNLYCKNLKFLNCLLEKKEAVNDIRFLHKTLYPIEKVVLAEGITEEILLPKFAQILGYDFDSNGVVVIPAGGKNQVAKEYIKLRERLNVPVVILLDADATEVANKISNKLRENDSLILIEKGEFEDILPFSLLKEAINYRFINILKIDESIFSLDVSRVKDLEEIYRINGLGEFKKAEFAHNIEIVLNENSIQFVSDEIKNIIEEIKNA